MPARLSGVPNLPKGAIAVKQARFAGSLTTFVSEVLTSQGDQCRLWTKNGRIL